MRGLVARAAARGVELKWFGAADPVAFTWRYEHWRYAAAEPLPQTDRILAGLIDMRLPLTFSPDDGALIARIMRAEVSAVWQGAGGRGRRAAAAGRLTGPLPVTRAMQTSGTAARKACCMPAFPELVEVLAWVEAGIDLFAIAVDAGGGAALCHRVPAGRNVRGRGRIAGIDGARVGTGPLHPCRA